MIEQVRRAVEADERWIGVAEPEEAAVAIAHLASRAAGYITGSAMRVE